MSQSVSRCATLAASIVLLLAAFALPAGAQTQPAVKKLQSGPPRSVIFIGNSFFYYNNGLHRMVRGLFRAANDEKSLRATLVTISGSGLNWHDIDSYFRPNAIGSYSFARGNRVVFNEPAKKLFDAAIVMDCSQCPVHPVLGKVFDEYIRKNTASIRKHGAEPVLFMSWAYEDRPEMTAQLADRYTRAGNDLKALVIPAGLAFARARLKYPAIKLHVRDKRHPTRAGSYLAAATTFAALYGRTPEGLGFRAGLPEETARKLQVIAWDTVRDFYR